MSVQGKGNLARKEIFQGTKISVTCSVIRLMNVTLTVDLNLTGSASTRDRVGELQLHGRLTICRFQSDRVCVYTRQRSNKAISSFQTFREARVPVAELGCVTEGSLRISRQIPCATNASNSTPNPRTKFQRRGILINEEKEKGKLIQCLFPFDQTLRPAANGASPCMSSQRQMPQSSAPSALWANVLHVPANPWILIARCCSTCLTQTPGPSNKLTTALPAKPAIFVSSAYGGSIIKDGDPVRASCYSYVIQNDSIAWGLTVGGRFGFLSNQDPSVTIRGGRQCIHHLLDVLPAVGDSGQGLGRQRDQSHLLWHPDKDASVFGYPVLLQHHQNIHSSHKGLTVACFIFIMSYIANFLEVRLKVYFHRPPNVTYIGNTLEARCLGFAKLGHQIVWLKFKKKSQIGERLQPIPGFGNISNAVKITEVPYRTDAGYRISILQIKKITTYNDEIKLACFATRSPTKNMQCKNPKIDLCALSEEISVIDGPSKPRLHVWFDALPSYVLAGNMLRAECDGSIGKEGALVWVVYINDTVIAGPSKELGISIGQTGRLSTKRAPSIMQ
ncbi:hypothetical protein PoB_002084300 [Plakobranchus ocellatus]|uniref:Uncharacterized protein n=1 Tax=Plakobranchus ocellatus TaxID=259542 RepID=A0AAV3ZHP9_9GAST|nr:hypothetical protein PoB_002084300 [Plakobranchus ocellatus]